jgi:hypothetical protein
MREKFLDLIIDLTKKTPNDFELGELIRRFMIVTDNCKNEIGIDELMKKLTPHKKYNSDGK